MHPSHIGQIERRTKKISIDALQRLAKALSIRMGELLEEPPPASYPWESKIGGLLRDHPEEQKRVLYSTLRHMAKEIRRRKRRRKSR